MVRTMRTEIGELRSLDQLREHYQVEKELAGRLRETSQEERRHLYTALYDELFRRVPHHPMLTQKVSSSERSRRVTAQLRFLWRFLHREATFLEIGAGDCALSFAVAGLVKRVYAVDVSAEITKNTTPPDNFQLILSDGCSIDLPRSSVDVAYSYQLVEHLHPDDASKHLENVCQLLTPGGVYVCLTPNRLNGPHDISWHFDDVASGFHLREYTVIELSRLFRKAGFHKVNAYVAVKGVHVKGPLFLFWFLEQLISALPSSFRKRHRDSVPFRVLLPIRLVGRK